MNGQEAVRLCQVIKALCPSQAFEDETPAVWHAVLADLPLADALEALKVVAQTERYVTPSDLIKAAKKIRSQRWGKAIQALPAPNVDPDDAEAYRRELRALERAAYDGTLDVEAYEAGGATLSGAPPLRRGALGPPDLPRLRALLASRKPATS